MKEIIDGMPTETALFTVRIQDKSGQTPYDVLRVRAPTDPAAELDQIGDLLNHAGLYNCEFYHLKQPPKILVFYSSVNRPDADGEKDCIVKHFSGKNVSCTVEKDPSEERIFSVLESAQSDADLSGLMVFIMTHGSEGYLQISGSTAGSQQLLSISKIISCMVEHHSDKPKVSEKWAVHSFRSLFRYAFSCSRVVILCGTVLFEYRTLFFVC